jgi:hypothetical protein
MHRRAKKLAEKFNDASTRRMADENARGAPAGPLYHYTTVDALFGIIKSETFWFTSIYYMDHDQDLSFGFGASHSLLSAALQREDVHVKTFLKPLVDDLGFARIKARFEFYSASFRQKDDPQQWTDYGAGGAGVALGLVPKFFSLTKSEDLKPEEKTFLGKVEYGETAAKIRHASVVDSTVSVVKQAYREGLLLKGEDEEEFLHLMAAEMYVELLWNSVTTKASKWSHQVETRLLAVNNLKDPQIEIKNGDKRPRVELPQPLLKSNITEVMLGPAADDDTKSKVRTFLDDNGLSEVPLSSAAAS